MKTALLFPGQGAQHVGMGRELCERYPQAQAVFAQADEALGFDLSRVCFEGPEDELNRTDICQPAILVHSWAVVEVLRANETGRALLDRAGVAAGLSLGEYSALAAAGALRWPDAARLVRARGRYMQDACDLKPSTMASIIGLDDDAIAGVVAKAAESGIVVAANFNAPGQVAVSGEIKAVEAAMEIAKEAGAKITKQLAVAGAFHSPLMEPARERLAAEIEAALFSEPALAVIANVDAAEHREPTELKANLLKQLTAPVLWAKSMQALAAAGYDEFIELGPGNVLAGLLKRVARKARRTSIGAPSDLENLG